MQMQTAMTVAISLVAIGVVTAALSFYMRWTSYARLGG